MTNDTIADMLTRIRNANLAKHQIVQIPSNTKLPKLYEIPKKNMFIFFDKITIVHGYGLPKKTSRSFFLIFIAGVILAVGNGFRMSLGIYVPDLITSTVFSAHF
jgi:hypothetical protein